MVSQIRPALVSLLLLTLLTGIAFPWGEIVVAQVVFPCKRTAA